MTKKLLLLAGIVSVAQLLYSQTLFTFGTKQVAKAEFLKAYNKNPNPNETDRKKALKEYLDLYINYKLKVQAAYDEKLQQQPAFKYESTNFKKQVADNIINEEANINELVKEAFSRSLRDIRVSQVFVEIKDGVDNMEANKQIQKAYEALQAGKDFAETAALFSNDEGTKQSKGDLGFITVFTLPYEFENEIFKLKQGQYSTPYRSSLGYHIFKNVVDREAVGKRKVAQVLITVPPAATDENRKKFAALADTIYQKAKRGYAFEKLVSEYSTDRASISNFGVLPEITVGSFTTDFEEKIFALQNIGEISKPFATQYGWHIVKLLEKIPVSKDFNDPVTSALIKQQVERADRLQIAKKGLVKKWMSLCKFKAGIFDEKEFLIFTDSAIKGGNVNGFKKVTPTTVLFSFAKQKVTASDWSKFVKAIKQSSSSLANKATMPLLREYEQIVCSEYYHEHLEDFNENLRQQSKEFDEANLLFSAMDKYVWSKAGEDSVGLKNYYNNNSGKYVWAAGASALVITTTTKETADEVIAQLKKDITLWRDVVSNYGTSVVADSSRYEINQFPVKQKVENRVGYITTPEKNAGDEAYTFLYITAVHDKPSKRNFDDARGMVINDYQQILEQKWIAELKKKYPIKINEAVWNTVK